MTTEQQRERTITQRRIGTIPLRQGIVRNTNSGDNGEMEDLMNMVYKDGAYRPVQLPKKLYDNKSGYYYITKHQTADYTNWIAYDIVHSQVKMFSWTDDAETVILDLTATGVTVLGIRTLKNYLILITNGLMLTFLYSDNEYKSIWILSEHALSFDFPSSSWFKQPYRSY